MAAITKTADGNGEILCRWRAHYQLQRLKFIFCRLNTQRSGGNWRDMLKSNRIGCSTVMLDLRALPGVRFPTDLGRQEDYALWLALLRPGGVAYGLDEVLVLYRVHPDSKSARKLPSVMAQWLVYRKIERMPVWLAGWYLGHYAVRGLLKSLR